MIDRRRLFPAVGAAGLAAALPLAARAETPALAPDAVAALDALRAGRDSAGGVLVAVRGGRTAGVYAWGKASLPFDVPVTARTLFHLGSNGKFMTSVAVAQLAEAGALGFDDPIGRHMADLPPAIGAVSISHLLHQTSGLVDYGNLLEDWDRPQTREIVLAALRDQPVLFQPGESWSYSNTNYLLLGWLIETLSGQSYAEYVQARLFTPAGTPTARADAAQQIVPGRAEPYEFQDGAFRHAVRMEDAVSRAADGGLLFSALDAAPWRSALDRNRLVSPATKRRLLMPAKLNSGRLAPYGCGVFLERARGQVVLRHGGGVPGFISDWVTWAEADLSVLAMTNSAARSGPSLTEMIFAMAESIQPGVTWRDQPPIGDGSDRRGRILRGLLERPAGAPAPDGLLAPELMLRPADRLRRMSAPFTLALLERWPAGERPEQGELERYRTVSEGRVRELVVGWTEDDRLYWL
ncbi:serine hydrolase domain-containing protein [Phenylobacterium sp.]|uniref:serine hydrolase domain-containing protein n=1 Tax=Phenylobacterium sp. TaxID=1871053 RepID=UPI002811BD5D|nr:serine hydrolase domain-containing protein [Phenylobacterium sp.]